MSKENIKKWLIRLGIIGLAFLTQVPFTKIFNKAIDIIYSFFENLGNGFVCVGDGNFVGGLSLFILVSFLAELFTFVIGFALEETDLHYITVNVIRILIAILIFIGMSLLFSITYNMDEEITEITSYMELFNEISNEDYYTVENVQSTFHEDTYRFDVSIIDSWTDKNGTTYNVKFDRANSDNTYYNSTIEIDQMIYNDIIGNDSDSISGQVCSLSLKIPYTVKLYKESSGKYFEVKTEYFCLDLKRYVFLGEQVFSETEIETIKEKFATAVWKYKNGNQQAFDTFFMYSNFQIARTEISQASKKWNSNTHMWNSKVAKKELNNIGIIFED